MADIRRSHLTHYLGLTVLVVLGSVLFPAVGSVSAAGRSDALTSIEVFDFGRNGRLADDGEDYFVFLPIIMRRWPPVPFSPVLTAVEDTVWDAPVRLDWQADVPLAAYPIETYVLEESTSADFSEVTRYPVPTVTVPYTTPEKAFGTVGWYHYRVRGQNAWGPGEWSNPVPTLLLSQRDDFDFPESGWAPKRTSYWDLDLMAVDYGIGDIVTRVEDRFDFAIFSPMQPAPELPYSIKMRTKIVSKANETSFGIVWGGNEGTFCDVERVTAADPNGCFSHYYRLNVIWGGYLKWGLARIDHHEGVADGGDGVVASGGGYSGLHWPEVGDPDTWNEWEIRVYDNGFELYVNGYYIAGSGDTTYVHDPYYGIFSSTYEYNGARFVHDHFYVEPIGGSATMSRVPVPDLLTLDAVSD
jgi:hypothetical protein